MSLPTPDGARTGALAAVERTMIGGDERRSRRFPRWERAIVAAVTTSRRARTRRRRSHPD